MPFRRVQPLNPERTPFAVERESCRALAVEEGVDGDLTEPRVEARLSAEALDAAVRLEPDLLREVFGVRAVAAEVEGERKDSPLVAPRDLAEGFGVAALRPPD